MADLLDKFNFEYFKARMHFDLRHNSIGAENWEKNIAESFGGRWVKGSHDLADAYNAQERVQFSVKSRKVEPQRKKRIESRDFFSHPSYYELCTEKINEIDLCNLHTVSRRCSIAGLDEQLSTPETIGLVAINDYKTFEQRSLKKFKCDRTLDVVIVHGESADGKNYLVRLMFFNHELNPIVRWEETFHGPSSKYRGKRYMIVGHDVNGPHIGRISNLGRQQTCMLRMYRKTEAIKIIETTIAIPEQEPFILANELLMMK